MSAERSFYLLDKAGLCAARLVESESFGTHDESAFDDAFQGPRAQKKERDSILNYTDYYDLKDRKQHSGLSLAVEWVLESMARSSGLISQAEDFTSLTLYDKVHLAARCQSLRVYDPTLEYDDSGPQYKSEPSRSKEMFVIRITAKKTAALSTFSAPVDPAEGLVQFHKRLRLKAEPFYANGYSSKAPYPPGYPAQPSIFRRHWWSYLKWSTGLNDDQLNSWTYKRIKWTDDDKEFKLDVSEGRLDTQEQYEAMLRSVRDEDRNVSVVFIRTWELDAVKHTHPTFLAFEKIIDEVREQFLAELHSENAAVTTGQS
ncbi:hypothetical protein F4818DRAFT_327922 [Hypoxylon cercidicola]|nr:hypothetical protein F4818DRAFT_327922 [Hypoxylon cercidicola]